MRAAAAAAVVACFCPQAGAGASLRSEGEQLYSVSAATSWATRSWDDHGDERDIDCDGLPGGERNSYGSLNAYAEYGWSYYHTVLAALGVGQGRCGAESETGLSDLRLGIRGRLNRYLNTKAWEVGVTIPLAGEPLGRSRVGCGAFGAWGGVDLRHEVVADWLSVGYGGQVQLWERPLAHEGRVELELSGRVVRGLSWQFGARQQFPLTEVEGGAQQDSVVECGTNAQSTRLGTELRYGLTRDASVGCGYTHAVWGENTSISRGASCAFTYIVR